MNLCINPDCNKPQNLDTSRFCANCGSELLLAGNLKVIKKLDCNAFCHTYEVCEVGSSITKVLKVSTSHQPFQKTAEVLQQLNHPGIPKVEKNGYFVYFPRQKQTPLHCLVMMKIEGINLLEYLAKQDNQPIEERLLLKWLSETIEILQQIHSHNLLHLHINPATILVKADGNLAIIGFGNRHLESKNIAYISPEQINDCPVPQSDFFALGRVFAFLLTGKEAASNIEIYESDLSTKLGSKSNYISWRNFTQPISPELGDLLDAMMASAPIQRPVDTQEILRSLANINPDVNLISIPNPTAIAKPINRDFVLYWILSTITGGSIGGLIGYVVGIAISFILSAAVKNIALGLTFGGAAFGVLIGMAIGVMQALVMRQSGFLEKKWALVTALGFAIEGVIGIFAGNYGSDSNFIFVPGIVVGLLQWLVLRNQVLSAFWWVLGSFSGGVVAVVINKAVTYFLGNAYTIFGCILGLIAFGIITGVMLVKLHESPKY
jgi:Protein kinase domain